MIQFIKNMWQGTKICFQILAVGFFITFCVAFFDTTQERKHGVSYFENYEPSKCKGYWAMVEELKENNTKYNPSKTLVADNESVRTHKVKKGETLFVISQMYHVPLEKLIRFNKRKETIIVNQIIRIK